MTTAAGLRDFSPTARVSDRMAMAFAAAATFLVAPTLVAWVTPWRLFDTLPAYIPMASSTALAILFLSGAAMLAVHRRSARLITAMAFLVAFGAKVQLVTLLAGSALIGRMSPWTAVALLLASVSLVFHRLPRDRRVLLAAGGMLALCVSLVGMVATVGYLFEAPALYGGALVPMAFPTALAVACLGLALVGLTPRDIGPLRPLIGASVRARLLRSLLPVAPAILVVQLLLAQVAGLHPALDAALTALATAGVVVMIMSYEFRSVGGALERSWRSVKEQTGRERAWRDAELAAIVERDDSEGKLAERALLESQAKLRALFESDLVGIIFGSDDGCIEDANEKFLSMVGYTREDLRAGLYWSALTAPEFAPLDAAASAEARARGACTPYEKQYLRKDGSRVWVLAGFVLLEPRRERAVVFVLDIETRKQTEGQLRSSEGRFARVFQTGLVAIAIAETRSGRLIDVNDACAQFFGYTRDEMVGRTALGLRLWVDPTARARVIANVAAGVPTSPMDVAFRRKSGEIRHALASLESMTLPGITEPLMMSVLVDQTESKHLESQLLQAQKMEAVGRLAGGVAHDFNNSLGVILGYTELLMRQAGEGQRGKLEQILKATQRATSLTRQLLAFSRKQVVDPKVLDLNALLSDLQTMLGRLIGEDIDLAIVPGAGLGQVKADPGQIEQVVMNLCVNARDAMPDGGLLRLETANIELDQRQATPLEPVAAGSYVMLTVTDAGSGMDKDTLSKIFEPFFTTKEEGVGTGLGLAMVYGIVKQAGGHIWVTSELKRGTTFTICLPRIDEAAAAPETEAPLPSRGSETILLVEDEGALREIAREILQEHGYAVIDAGSATDAIDVAHRHPAPIHLLLTDVVMPGMNGRALAETLVAARPALRVLYMSGYTDDVIAHRGVLEPGTLLLEKPFNVLALLGRVRAALGVRAEG